MEPSGSFGEIPRGTPPPPGVKRLVVLLIKPSKYDDDGYVMRYARGVLPSNTLAALAGLTEEAAEKGALGPVDLRVRVLDEHVQRIDVRRLSRFARLRRTRVVAALCGVQSNQFPRASDLAREFRRAGIPVLIGGFHVSGAVSMSPAGMPPECAALLEQGITLVKGEVEEAWADLLRDALHRRLRPFYDVAPPPGLSAARIPVVDPRHQRRYASSRMATIDTARGCPFDCSFCSVINVQGRRMRCRAPGQILERIRANRALGITNYFFTDDNFARNPHWEEILDGLIALRREGFPVQFMTQVDTAAHRIPGFVAKAAAAGCTQVFLGVESLDPRNMAASGKRQNRVGEYRGMVQAWHAAGIVCHAAFIIGMPFDTAESSVRDAVRLRDEIGVDQASFFMYTPIPGSRDHRELARSGAWMDDDLNRYDSFHPTLRHPRMSAAEWTTAFRRAWSEFYTVAGMKAILARAPSAAYWNVFKNFLWYRYSIAVEATHPMICGFFRRKDRRQRRPGFAVDPVWAHLGRRRRELASWMRGVIAVYYEMQEVWLATRAPSGLERRIGEWKRSYDLASLRALALLARWNPMALRARTRADLDAYWDQLRHRLRRGRVLGINPLRLVWNAVRDVRLCLRFNASILASLAR